MVNLVTGLVLLLIAPIPSITPLVRSATRAIYIHRRIRANTGPILSAMDKTYSGVIRNEKLTSLSVDKVRRDRRRLLQALAVHKVLKGGCLQRTPTESLRLSTAVDMMIPVLLRQVNADLGQVSMVGTQAFLNKIRAANAAATALWLQQQSRRMYSLLLSMGIDGSQDIPARLRLAAKKGDKAAARLLRRMNDRLAFSFVKRRLRDPMAGSGLVRAFGLLPDPRYPVRIAGPGIILAWSGSLERNVRAVTEGMVRSVSDIPGIGLTIVLDHGNGLRSVYGGLAYSAVSVNEMVVEGSLLGRVQSKKTPCMLFFAMEADGKWTDPLRFIVIGEM